MDGGLLQHRLKSLGRRLIAVGAGLGLGWGIGLAGLLFATAVWLDLALDLSGSLRLALIVGAATTALAVGTVFIVRAWNAAKPLALASSLDYAADGHGRIATAADLALDPSERSPVSTELARMAIADATALAAKASSAAAVPAKSLVVPFGSTAVVAALFVGVAIFLPRLASMQWARFADPFGDHPPYSPLVLTVQPGDAKVHYGGNLDVVALGSGAPIEKMELVVRGSGADVVLPMFPETGERWRTTLVQITEPSKYFVRSGKARSGKYDLNVVTAPQISNVKVRVSQPKYAHRPVYEGPIPKEGLSGLLGAQVEIWATSNRPLREGSASLTLAKGVKETVTLSPISSGGQEVHGGFAVRESGKFELRLTDDAGEPSTDSVTAAIHRLNDERPFVRIIEPKEASFATPTASLPVVLSAEDDYGIAKLQLFRSLNGSRASPVDLILPPPPVRLLETDVILPLSQFTLRAGDEIQLFARVEDTNPAGAQGSESPVVTIRIIEQSDYERLTQRQQGVEALLAKYQQAERRMESMVEEIDRLQKKLAEKQDQGKPVTPEERKELQKLSEQLAEEAKAMEALAKQALPYDVDKETSKEIAKLAEALKKAGGEAAKTAAKSGLSKKSAQVDLAELKKQLAKKREEFEQNANKPIGDMAKAYALMEDEAKFLEIYRRQRDLERRMASLKGKERVDDPASRARMRDLEAEQRDLRESLRQLVDDIEAHANQLPDSKDLEPLRETALKFATDLRASGATEVMASCEAALAEFSGTKSAAASKEAADILEKFIKRCEGDGMGEACKNCLPKFQPKLSNCMGSTLDQLLANAGLKRGPGTGAGAGGQPGMSEGARDGYSMASNSLKNVGLYGNLPTTQSSNGRGTGNQRAGDGRRVSATPGQEQHNRVAATTGGDAKVVGDSNAQVPAPYRRRVAEYFQRIADENADR